MNSLLLLVIALVALGCGYRFYGTWLSQKWGVDNNKETPAHTMEDGIDYVPAKAPVLMGHHFSSIAGAGPITGPISAAAFGWLPCSLWIIIGGIFFGGVHDYGALFASVRHGGKSIGEIISANMSKRAKSLFIIFAYLTLILVVAAFASISGYPINEFHLHHTGCRPVPFLHIHGKSDDFVKYSLVPNIIYNMVARNGANPTPVVTTKSGKYKKSVFEATEGGFPVVYYEIDGMGHNPDTNNTEDGNSAKTMWNFMKQYTLDSPCDTTLKWRPNLEQEGWEPKKHGWTLNSGLTICSFAKEQDTGSNGNANSYPSLQFIKGNYRLTFNAIGEEGKTVNVQLKRLSGKKDVVFKETVEVGNNRAIEFEIPDKWCEFSLSFTKTASADDIKIEAIEIHSYDPNAVGIRNITSIPSQDETSIYNLRGQRINAMHKGINILNGRKVLVK